VAPRLASRAQTVGDIIETMASWRDSASEQAQDDLDGLLNMTLPFAQQMPSKSGEFYPFGATVTTKGETRLLAGDLGHEHPASADVHSLLVDRLRQDRARFRQSPFAPTFGSPTQTPSGSSLSTRMDTRWLF
jgi:hypothetical protein